jgi:hypothetical protein
MSLVDLEMKLAQLHSNLCSANAAAEGQQDVQPDLAEPGYPTDKAVAYGCVALKHLYQDPATSPNQALRAWAYHHHLASTDMGLDQLKEEPLALLALLAEAVEAQPRPDDLWVCSHLNYLLDVLSAALGYTPEYFGPLPSTDEENEVSQPHEWGLQAALACRAQGLASVACHNMMLLTLLAAKWQTLLSMC